MSGEEIDKMQEKLDADRIKLEGGATTTEDGVVDETAQQIEEEVANLDIDPLAIGEEQIVTDDTSAELEEKPVFELKDFQPAENEPLKVGGETQDAAPPMRKFVHNGQVIEVTDEKATELEQKGYDYDFKVGPHGKLVEMLDSDPDFADEVDRLWNQRLNGGNESNPSAFEGSDIDDHDDDRSLLQENMDRFAERLRQSPAPINQESVQPQVPAEDPTQAALRMRDPEFYELVQPRLNDFVPDLSVKNYNAINSDMNKLCQFYDFVKEQVIPKQNTNSPTNHQPNLRMKSGHSKDPGTRPVKKAWDLSREDFQKQLDKMKGY